MYKRQIIDDEKALVGSMNLTKPSIENNRELSIVTSDKNILEGLERTFNFDNLH